jgi:hypothetical protein
MNLKNLQSKGGSFRDPNSTTRTESTMVNNFNGQQTAVNQPVSSTQQKRLKNLQRYAKNVAALKTN